MGTLRLMPRMFALSAVHRHTAASRSASPWISVQHGFLGGVPSSRLISPLSTFAHTPSFSASIGHLPSPPDPEPPPPPPPEPPPPLPDPDPHTARHSRGHPESFEE